MPETSKPALRLPRLVQSAADKYRFPGIQVSEARFWKWREFLCRVRGHGRPFASGYNAGNCRCCFRKIANG